MSAASFIQTRPSDHEIHVLRAWSSGEILSIDAQLSLGLGSHEELLERAMLRRVSVPIPADPADRLAVIGVCLRLGRSSRPRRISSY